MHKIIESFADQSFEIETSVPIDAALRIVDLVKSLEKGRFKLLDQSFQTDGPSDVAKIIFNVQKAFDKRTKAIMAFSIFGEYDKLSKKGAISVRIKGRIEATMPPEKGVILSAMDDYYLKNVYKALIEKAKDTYESTVKIIKKEFR